MIESADIQHAGNNGFLYGAAWFAAMPAVAEGAVAGVCLDLGEHPLDPVGGILHADRS